MPSLKIFQVLKIGQVVVLFDAIQTEDVTNPECKIIIIDQSVTMIDMSWQRVSDLVQILQKDHFRSEQEHSFSTASIVCFVRDKDIDEETTEEEEGFDRESYDDQLLSYYDYIHVSFFCDSITRLSSDVYSLFLLQACKKEEAAGSIFELRHSIKEIYHDLQQRQAHHPHHSKQQTRELRQSSNVNFDGEDRVLFDPTLAASVDHALEISHDDIPPPPPSSMYPSSLENTETLASSMSASHRRSIEDITPPPQVPYHVSSSRESLAPISGSRLSSPAILPSSQSAPKTPLSLALQNTSRPNTASKSSTPHQAFAAMYDTDDEHLADNNITGPPVDEDHLMPLPDKSSQPHSQKYYSEDQRSSWGEGSQSITVFRHEEWGQRNFDKDNTYKTRHSNSQDTHGFSDQDHHDDVQCNQSLSEFSPSKVIATTRNDASATIETAVDVQPSSYPGAHNQIGNDLVDNDASVSSSVNHSADHQIARNHVSLDLSSASTNYIVPKPDEGPLQSLLREDYVDSNRTLDEIIRDTAPNLSIDPPRQEDRLPPTITVSPTKPQPTPALNSPAVLHNGNTINAKETKGATQVVSESLQKDLLASEAGENFLQYAQRAYMVCERSYMNR